MRSLAPAETLVYLESKDLSQTLNALAESKTFQEAAKEKPDFSAVEGVSVAVVVTGFEASEKQLTAENAVLNFKPRFVAIADTRAWNWQTLSLTENQIGNFVNEILGGGVNLEITDKNGGRWFVWTSEAGEKIFAFVEGSLIFFGNDETAIEKCLAVRRGEADNLLKNESFNRIDAANTENNLAFGYVLPEGVAQISNLAGVSVANEAAEEAEEKSFIARILLQFLQANVREIVWTAQKSEQGIEDKFAVSLNTEAASVFKETLEANAQTQTDLAEFLPSNISSATRYSLKNPLAAWQSLLLVTAKSVDDASRNVFVQYSNSLLQSYGITDAQSFLSAVDSEILTAQFDAEGEKSVVIATIKDAEKLKKSLAEINFKSQPEKQSNAEIWQSEDKQTAAAFVENKLILGDAESVRRCLEAKQTGENFAKAKRSQKFSENRAVAVTVAKDFDSTGKIVKVLSAPKDENKRYIVEYTTETRATEKGIERKTVSDFGLIGTIIEQFSREE